MPYLAGVTTTKTLVHEVTTPFAGGVTIDLLPQWAGVEYQLLNVSLFVDTAFTVGVGAPTGIAIINNPTTFIPVQWGNAFLIGGTSFSDFATSQVVAIANPVLAFGALHTSMRLGANVGLQLNVPAGPGNSYATGHAWLKLDYAVFRA